MLVAGGAAIARRPWPLTFLLALFIGAIVIVALGRSKLASLGVGAINGTMNEKSEAEFCDVAGGVLEDIAVFSGAPDTYLMIVVPSFKKVGDRDHNWSQQNRSLGCHISPGKAGWIQVFRIPKVFREFLHLFPVAVKDQFFCFSSTVILDNYDQHISGDFAILDQFVAFDISKADERPLHGHKLLTSFAHAGPLQQRDKSVSSCRKENDELKSKGNFLVYSKMPELVSEPMPLRSQIHWWLGVLTLVCGSVLIFVGLLTFVVGSGTELGFAIGTASMGLAMFAGGCASGDHLSDAARACVRMIASAVFHRRQRYAPWLSRVLLLAMDEE